MAGPADELAQAVEQLVGERDLLPVGHALDPPGDVIEPRGDVLADLLVERGGGVAAGGGAAGELAGDPADHAGADPVARRQAIGVGVQAGGGQRRRPRVGALGLEQRRQGHRHEAGIEREVALGAGAHHHRAGVLAQHVADRVAQLGLGGLELLEAAQHRDQAVHAGAEQRGAQRGDELAAAAGEPRGVDRHDLAVDPRRPAPRPRCAGRSPRRPRTTSRSGA